jgi:hypothetical protein
LADLLALFAVYVFLLVAVIGGLVVAALAAILFTRTGQVETACRVRVVILALDLVHLHDDFFILDAIDLFCIYLFSHDELGWIVFNYFGVFA